MPPTERNVKAPESKEEIWEEDKKKSYFNIKPIFSPEPIKSLNEACARKKDLRKGSYFYFQPGSCSPREETRGGSLSAIKGQATGASESR